MFKWCYESLTANVKARSVTFKLSAVFHDVSKGAHLENNQSGINNDFYSRHVFHANAFDKHYDYYSEDNKKEISLFQDKTEGIVSVLMKNVYIEKCFADFSFYILQNQLLAMLAVCIRVLSF